MTAPRDAEAHVLSVAESIAGGRPVDWERATASEDAETRSVLTELRALETVARMAHCVPDAWGPFEILGELGQGAHGTVYHAFDPALRVEIALKVTRPAGASAAATARRALNEARLLAQINHPNVVRIYRAEHIGDEVGVAMELVRGHTLSDWLKHHGALSANETMLIGIDVCGALAAVHGVGLVHGDVKAHNVMRANGGRTVLMDFGAGFDAKADDRAGRRFVGTPVYLAPEVFAGQPRTAVSDIYGLGVLLFHLVTGEYPVDGRTGTEIGRRHQTQTPRRLLRDLRPDLPDAFIDVVERATATLPAARPPTAGALEAALLHAMGQATPAPRRRVLSRSRVLAAMMAVVLVVGGLGYTFWPDATARPAVTIAAPPDIATAADDGSYRIEAAFYRATPAGEERLTPAARIAKGDRLMLRVTSSVPMHVYVVNEDDHGESFLLYPLRGMPLTNPIASAQRHEIPGTIAGERLFWEVSSAGGREHFLIFASPTPLSPVFQRVFDALPAPTFGGTAPAQPVTRELAGVLRGVGGLTKAPAARPSLAAEFGAPLVESAETARGVWVRQLTVGNPIVTGR